MGILGALLLLGGCGGSETPPDRSESENPFPGSAVSLEELGKDVLRGLVRGDTVGLERLRLTESEHNGVVWPELPASAPELNFPVDLAWQNIQLRNRRDLRRILPWFRERGLTFRAVQCRGPVEEFETFRVHTDCHVVFQSAEHGLLEIQIFKDVLEREGGYKIFRFYDNRPRTLASR